jgi:hypothetical protein
MHRQEQQEPQKRVVYAPQPNDAQQAPAVISVALDEDEDVEWQWTHYNDGRSVITGYTIVKRAEQQD